MHYSERERERERVCVGQTMTQQVEETCLTHNVFRHAKHVQTT
jgi:hypothetical protein